jgi:hypothetical protein
VKRERLQSRRDLPPFALPQALDFFRRFSQSSLVGSRRRKASTWSFVHW